MTVIKRALISVSDKSNLLEFTNVLVQLGIEILSTGGTAKYLENNGITVIEIANYTNFPELFGGRLKTLHPRIHGGILGRRGQDDEVLKTYDILPIDLVIVNLYPFETQIARTDSSLELAIENIDIGGPTLLRAAAKNYAAVTVIVDPADYSKISQEIQATQGTVGDELRFDLAVKAFEHTARYDGAIANYLGKLTNSGQSQDFSRTLTLQFVKAQELRYGENPHQTAAFYREQHHDEISVANSLQIQGKELSFNNIADADAALECLKQFPENATCVIVKHANPCGVAIGNTLFEAYDRAWRTDPESAFGGIIAINQELDVACAQIILDRQFVEVILAPTISASAKQLLAKKPNVRLLLFGNFQATSSIRQDYKRVTGGILIQQADLPLYTELNVVTNRTPTESEMRDLLFTWRVAKFVKSNAIVYGRDLMTIGVGAGQMSRINSARIASIKAEQAGLTTQGAVLASDAFFPFRDGLDQAAQAGIKAVIQPGGSMRDQEIIDAANEHDIAMIFTGMRHFRH